MLCFPPPFPTFPCCRRPLVEQLSFIAFHFLPLCLLQAFSPSGDALRVSPDLVPNITAVTFRRRLNSYFEVYSLGLMRPLCCGIKSHPSLLSPSTCLNAVVYLSLIILSAGCLVGRILPKLLPWPRVGSASVSPPERCNRA